jgi:L-fucose mutarotase/ribose pyranase (RbsD/FucU family)
MIDVELIKQKAHQKYQQLTSASLASTKSSILSSLNLDPSIPEQAAMIDKINNISFPNSMPVIENTIDAVVEEIFNEIKQPFEQMQQDIQMIKNHLDI